MNNIKLKFSTMKTKTFMDSYYNLTTYLNVEGSDKDGHTHQYYVREDGAVFDEEVGKEYRYAMGDIADANVTAQIIEMITTRLNKDIEWLKTMLWSLTIVHTESFFADCEEE